MQHRLLIVPGCTLLFALAGCGQDKPQPPAAAGKGIRYPVNNDHLNVIDHRGTGMIWGINFDVQGVAGDPTLSSTLNGSTNGDPDMTYEQYDIRMGDVSFHLERVPGQRVTFKFQDQDCGTLDVDDKVFVDKERKLTVNGVARAQSNGDTGRRSLVFAATVP